MRNELQAAVARKANLTRSKPDSDEYRRAVSDLALLQCRRDIGKRISELSEEHRRMLATEILEGVN